MVEQHKSPPRSGRAEIKIVLLGDSSVGKTSIVQRFAQDKFNPTSQATYGAAFVCKTVEVPELSVDVKFQIWDTAGQEKYHSMASMYYQDAAAAIIVFDTTKEQTFEGIKMWMKELQEKGPKDICLVIAGNKSDLVDDQKVDFDKARECAVQSNAYLTFVSAKEGLNISEIFFFIARTIVKPEIDNKPAGADGKDKAGKKVRDSVKVTVDGKGEKKSSGCCK